MARIEAEVVADIRPFERALHRATEEAREFAEKTKDIGKDVFKDTVGGKAFNLAGMAGGAAAVTALGAAIVDTAKEGLDAFGHFETKVLELKANLKDPEVAKQTREWLAGIATAPGEIDKLQSAFTSLVESGLTLDQSKKTLLDLQAVAIKSGESVESLGESFRKAKARGSDMGEGVTKLLNSLPGLSRQIEEDKAALASAYETGLKSPPGMTGGYAPSKHRSRMEAAEKIRSMSAQDYVKSGLLNTEDLEKKIHELAPPGIVTEKKGTLEGKEGELDKVIEDLKIDLGEKLAPSVERFIDTISENLPTLEEDIKQFGESIGSIIDYLNPKKDNTPKLLKGEEEWEKKILGGLWDMITGNVPGFAKGDSGRTVENDKAGILLSAGNLASFPKSKEMEAYSEKVAASMIEELRANNVLHKEGNNILQTVMTIGE